MIDLRKKDPVADTVKDLLQQEGWDDMVKSAKDTLKDKPQDGGSGVKKGSRYGGSKQKDEPEKKETTKEEVESVDEALKGNQKKIDKNHNNKIDAQDFKILRKEETVEEGIKDLAKKAFKAITGGSDEDQRKNLQKKMGIPQTGKVPEKKNEEVELDERSLTPGEEKTKEHNVKSMKKNFAGFRERYGKDAKSVMYATATKQAKNEEVEQIDEISKETEHSYFKKAYAQKNDPSTPKAIKRKRNKGMDKVINRTLRRNTLSTPGASQDFKDQEARRGVGNVRDSVELNGRVMDEARTPQTDTLPFDPPYNTTSGTEVVDKSGAKHTPMSRVKHLARQAMKKVKKDLGSK